MTALNKRAFAGLLGLALSMAASLFIPPWTLHYWQAWVFLLTFIASAMLISLYLMKNDPKLMERRVYAGPAAEKEPSQKLIQSFARIAFIATLVFPALDRRFQWSSVPPYVAIAGDFLVALGFFIIFIVFKENSFASGSIEIQAQQEVVSTGPYALVRHPMYSGAIVMLMGVPIALGSWWGLLTLIPFTAVIVWRLLDEEVFLAKNLPGYPEYCHKVRYRLLPFLW